MRDSLKAHIRELAEATAARERHESELKIARRIQADMLPPPRAGGPADLYELGAALVPARAVGGDLFDHFRDGDRLFFLVGDVSGKGVGAALFMARARTLFQARIPDGEFAGPDPRAYYGDYAIIARRAPAPATGAATEAERDR